MTDCPNCLTVRAEFIGKKSGGLRNATEHFEFRCPNCGLHFAKIVVAEEEQK